ncbi:protein FAM172A-like [Scleropages formosus]|uniref:Protein FAM172A-like n=1 Tax=Scleropages formosus TaxID=113540 RepID=A0A0P7UUM9_SCLFO|nr:protein FAM172A-like [Scleropages formosus]
MERTEPQGSVPLLPDFPYRFGRDGRLCHVDTREPFVFGYRRGDALGTQQRHRVLGRYITQHVYDVLHEEYGLRQVSLPPGGSDLRGQNLLLVSPKALESQGNLMVLIQDRGTVRCGQWSWKVIAREGLERGSQIPYVRRALAEAWEVLLMNPNAGGSPEDHVSLVWNLLLSRCAAKNIAVVAHGYGGGSRDWLKANAKKWVLSCKPLNRPVGSLKADCPQLSAGTQCHEAAPATCMDPLFRFFAKAVKAKPATVPFDIITRSKSRGRLSQGTAAAVPGKP